MSRAAALSWGRAHRYEQARRVLLRPGEAELLLREAAAEQGTVLGYGLGRSYGDSCLNPRGLLLDVSGLDCIEHFDAERGLLRAEAGLSLDALLQVTVPRGWFLPVTPGSKFVTLGGAVANDVHGKNHHLAGSFGHHVRALELLTSDGRRRELAPGDALFEATVGGLGLTGLITAVELELAPIRASELAVEHLAFRGLEEFCALSEASAADWAFTVAWVDCVNLDAGEPRGVFMRGNFAAEGPLAPHGSPGPLQVPVELPAGTLNRWTVSAFNRVYFRAASRHRAPRRIHYDPFFYPLDGVGGWNRIYGPRGFYQYQFAVPTETAVDATREAIGRIAASGQGSFLSVLKQFGDRPPAGLLSFPLPGLTLALDFRNRGRATLELFEALDRIVLEAGGRLYPAKDGRMPAATFRAMYPGWEAFSRYRDPLFSSAFWERVSGD